MEDTGTGPLGVIGNMEDSTTTNTGHSTSQGPQYAPAPSYPSAGHDAAAGPTVAAAPPAPVREPWVEPGDRVCGIVTEETLQVQSLREAQGKPGNVSEVVAARLRRALASVL